MRFKLISLIVAVIFIVSACGSNDTASSPDSPSSKGQVYSSLEEVKALGKPMKCMWENPINKGTFWAFGEKSKTESLVGPTTFFLLDDGTYRYTWQSGANQGTKIRTATQKAMEAESGARKQGSVFLCEETSLTPSFFVPPADVNFFDVGG